MQRACQLQPDSPNATSGLKRIHNVAQVLDVLPRTKEMMTQISTDESHTEVNFIFRIHRDQGRARQTSLATAGTNFTKPGAHNKGDLCTTFLVCLVQERKVYVVICLTCILFYQIRVLVLYVAVHLTSLALINEDKVGTCEHDCRFHSSHVHLCQSCLFFLPARFPSYLLFTCFLMLVPSFK